MTALVIDMDDTGVFRKGDDTEMQTSSGGRISINNPSPEDIDILDIATAIAKQCRYNGHCNDFYSVAQHCSLGALFAFDRFNDRELAKEVLLHDATEAYIGDLIRPVKVQLSKFIDIENGLMAVIAEKYSVPPVMSSYCKEVDNIMLAWEKRDLLPNSEPWPNMPDIIKYNLPQIQCWNWRTAESIYVKMFNELFRG